MGTSTWTVVEPNLPALAHRYSFGSGYATSLALTLADGGIIVVSPPSNVADAVYTDLEARGPLRALIAPNAFHSMGLAPWQARYPSVPIFAPVQSIPRLQKTTKLSVIRPLEEAAGLVGDCVELVDMPHYKTGEALIRWRTEGGWAWFMTDVAFNLPKLPPGPFGLVMKWTKSAPGFRRYALAPLFMIKDKRKLYAWIEEQAAKTPPVLVVPCHGEPVTLADPVAGVRAAFA
jgi:hypothetical protein